jgi:hypothetical protein
VPKCAIINGIQAVRKLFPRLWFNRENTKQLRRALENYHKQYNPKKKNFEDTPYHDWSSHFADATRYMAVSIEEEGVNSTPPIRSMQARELQLRTPHNTAAWKF